MNWQRWGRALRSGEWLLFAGFLLLYATTAARTVGFGDGGEVVACGSVWGVLHSPGDPLYLVCVALSQLAGRLVGWDPAFSTHLVSAAAAAIALVLLMRLARLAGASWGGAWLAAVTLGVSPAFWNCAHSARVDCVSLALPLAAWGALARPDPQRAGRWWGLALAAHAPLAWLAAPSLLLLLTRSVLWAALPVAVALLTQKLSGAALVGALPGLLLLALASRDGRLLPPHASRLLGKAVARGVVPSLLLFVVLPLRAWTDPPLNWGDAFTPRRLWELLWLHDFQALYSAGPLRTADSRLWEWWELLRHQFAGGALLPLALLGAGRLAWRRPRWFYASFLTVLLQAGWLVCATRLPAEADPGLLSLAMISLWVGVGGFVAVGLGRWLLRRGSEALRRIRGGDAERPPADVSLGVSPSEPDDIGNPAARIGTRRRPWAMLLCLLPVLAVRPHWQEVQRVRETFAADYGYNVLSTAAPRALLLTRSEDATFPLFYWQVSRGFRRDVKVVFTDLLELDWYRGQLSRRGVHVPSRYGEIASWAIANSDRPIQADVWAARAMGGRMQATMQGVLFNFRGVAAGRDQRTLLSSYRSGGVFEARVRKDDATERVLQAYSLALDALGQQLATEGQVEAATEQWKRAIQVAPQREVTAHLLLARALKDQGKPDQVEAELDAVLRIEPANVAAHQLLFQNTRDLAPSRPLPPPNDPVAFNQQRAGQLNQEGIQAILGRPPDPVRAAQLWKEAARLDPRLGQPHVNLGNLYRAQGELRSALREYQEALRLQPNLPIAHFNLGDVYERMGDPARARDQYRQEVARGSRPDNQGVFDRARARLKALQP